MICRGREADGNGNCKTCGKMSYVDHVAYGMYSEAAASLVDRGPCPPGRMTHGANLYGTPDGRTVWVTGIDSDPECSSYSWPDKVLVGEIVRGDVRGWREGRLFPSEVEIEDGFVDFLAEAPTETSLQIGDRCPKCKHEWKERALLTSVYVGCMC